MTDRIPDKLKLSSEVFEYIRDGMDIRDFCRSLESVAVETEEQIRIQAAIYLIMYSIYPLALTEVDIWKKINEIPYHLMDDETFNAYADSVRKTRLN